MEIHSLNDISKLKESHEVEFKKAEKNFPKDAWKTYSAFANTNGGYLILGISEDDDKKPILTGVKDENKVIDDFCSLLGDRSKVSINLIQPDNICTKVIEGKVVLIIYVPEASLSDKPVYLNKHMSNAYVRVHSQDHLADKVQLSAMIRNQSSILDYELLDNYGVEDLDFDSIIAYKKILNDRNPLQNFSEMDNNRFLEKIGVLKKDRQQDNSLKLTLGGLLFFGKYNSITDKIAYYHLDFFDKRGEDTRWSDRIESGNFDFPEMNLFNYYRLVHEKLTLSIKREFLLDENIIRKNPTDLAIALRESFVNMIIHADYLLDTTPLIVEIHEPYYLFTNPGIMKISVNEFLVGGGKSLVRNPLLVSLFTRMGAAEHAGSGSQKIIDVVVKNKFKEPEFKTDLSLTELKLWTAEPFFDIKNLKEDEKKVCLYIHNGGSNQESYTKRELLEQFGDITKARMNRILESLYEQNLITKYGGNKNRTYGKVLSKLELIHLAGKTYDEIKHIISTSEN